MCHTTMSGNDDVSEISSSTSNKKTGKLIEPRKIRKPLMEKKRRARINQSLDELKRIVVDAQKMTGQDLSRINKLEKADILEMTVKYLKRNATPSADVYMTGYRQCIEHVQELMAEQWTDERRRQSGRRMVEHLETSVQQLNRPRQKNRTSESASSCFTNEPDLLNNEEQPVGTIGNRWEPLVVRNNCSSSSTSSSDEDSVEESELLTVAPDTASNDHKTKFQNTPPLNPTWRPW